MSSSTRSARPFHRFLSTATPPPGSLAGVIRDAAGNPLPGAVALVSTVRGQVYQSRSDAQGSYRIDGLPPGRYVPMAGASGYDAINGSQVQVKPGQLQTGIDFVLPIHQRQPVEPAGLIIGKPHEESSQFPEPMVATRIPFTFTLDGVTIDNGQIYLPTNTLGPVSDRAPTTTPLGVPPRHPRRPVSDRAPTTTPLGPVSDRAPTTTPLGPVSDRALLLVIIYPSHPLNWNAASVALTRQR